MGGGLDSVRLWFLLWRGVAIWAGASGVPWGWFPGCFCWSLRPWPGCGIGDSWMLFSLAAACGACWGWPVPADVGCQPGRRTVSGLVRGGGLGIWGRSGLRVGCFGWSWGAWVLVGVPPGAMGWWHALGARLWCGGLSMLRCLRRGGGSQ